MTELDIEQLIQDLTLSEKISFLAGVDFWHTTKTIYGGSYAFISLAYCSYYGS